MTNSVLLLHARSTIILWSGKRTVFAGATDTTQQHQTAFSAHISVD